MATLTELLENLSASPQRRGKQFEHVCKWYLQNEPEYAAQLKRVWYWEEWPGRKTRDIGIDLVAETEAGELWAIQAKAYDPAYSVKKKDVDTFISAAPPNLFDYRLLIATTNRIGKNAVATMEANGAGLRMLARLERAEIGWPSSPDELRPVRAAPKIPRHHQREALKAVASGFETSERGQLIMACGTGKTLTAVLVAEKLKSRRTLVLVPSLSLLSQTIREWTANSRRPFKFLSVCSDETVWDEEDQWVSNTAELGFPVTTNPADIAAFLRRRGPSVVFSTYQSSPRIAEAYRADRVPGFDLAIADEAHRCAGRVSADFATILDAYVIKSKRRLFMTATPRYLTRRVQKAARDADYEVASMDDETMFGPQFHRLSFGEAIERDLLSDYQVVIVGVDNPTYRAFAEKGSFVTIDGREVTDARTLASHIGLAKAMRNYDLRRTITFHGRVKRAREFAGDFEGVVAWMPSSEKPPGDIWTSHVSGEMPTGERDVRLQRLRDLTRDERGLLSNARCLAEGVDVPTLDAVSFIDPRRSQVDIVQAVGRAIRKADDKSVGTVVLPVFVDDTDDPEEALDTSAFKAVWDVLKALRAHDGELGEELDALRREMGRLGSGHGNLPEKLTLNLPVGVDPAFATALQTRIVVESTASWEYRFGLLKRWIDLHGDKVVPTDAYVDGYRLGGWISVQRTRHKRGLLSRDRFTRLDALPGWVWDAQDSRFEEGLQYLKAFIATNGHGNIPSDYVNSEGYPLGTFVARYRSLGNRGKLPAHRYDELMGLRPHWSWDRLSASWEEHYEQLKGFFEANGHSRVPQGYRVDGFGLGAWVSIQRSKRASLSQEQVDRLDTVGFVWAPDADAWEKGFEHLQHFVRREGHAEVPARHIEEGFQLGGWLSAQRSATRRGRLPPERKRLLDDVNVTWAPQEAAWEAHFDALCEYLAASGLDYVPRAARYQGMRLGEWVNNQRVRFRAGKLTDEQVERVNHLSARLLSPAQYPSWDEYFGTLAEYAEIHGHSRVPQKHNVGRFRLGAWVARQRRDYREDRLDPDRASRLSRLPEWTWGKATGRRRELT